MVSQPEQMGASGSSTANVQLSLGPPQPSNSRGWNWRQTVAQVMYRTGLLNLLGPLSQRYEVCSRPGRRFPILRRPAQPKYSILCYHRVGTEGIPFYSTLCPSVFEAQMRFLREHFRVISLGQLCYELEHPTDARHGVAVTFDDGYSDLYTYALPILRKYEIPATIYLTADCIETGNVAWYDRIFLALQVAPGPTIDLPMNGGSRASLGSAQQRVDLGGHIVTALRRTSALERKRFCSLLEQQVSLPDAMLEARMLSWKQVAEMRSAGIFFGSHTLSHPVLSGLSAEEVHRELSESKRILEARLGEPVLDFAYPFGKAADYGPVGPATARSCGYRSAVTTAWGTNTPGADMHALRRVQLGDESTLAKFGLQLHREFLRGDCSSLQASGGALRKNANGGRENGNAALASR